MKKVKKRNVGRYHFYQTIDGKKLHGVTTVLGSTESKDAIINWQKKLIREALEKGDDLDTAFDIPNKVLKAAGTYGTAIHEWLENFVNMRIAGEEGLPELPEDEKMKKSVLAVVEWADTNEVEFLESEKVVYNLEKDLFYAGTMDVLLRLNDQLYVADFKSSNNVYANSFIQCGAYSLAMRHMKEVEHVHGAVVLHIPQSGKFKPHFHYNCRKLEETFIHCLKLYRERQKLHDNLVNNLWKKKK